MHVLDTVMSPLVVIPTEESDSTHLSYTFFCLISPGFGDSQAVRNIKMQINVNIGNAYL